MNIEEYLYSKLIAIRNFNLRSTELGTSFAPCVYGLTLDVRSSNPWQSILHLLYDTKENIRSRRLFEKRGDSEIASVYYKWDYDDWGILWIPHNVDHLYPNHKAIALRDEYLESFGTQDTQLLSHALVDLCARVILRFHEEQVATQPQNKWLPITLEIVSSDTTLYSYAQDQGWRATPADLQDQYRSIVNTKNHDIMIRTGMNKALSKITLANKVARGLADYTAKCRANNPVPTLSDLSPVERDQYQQIRQKLEKWLPNLHRLRTYTLRVFDTCRPGLTAFHDLANSGLTTTFCLTTDEYKQYWDIEHVDKEETESAIIREWHTFEQPNLNVYNPIVYGNNPIKTTYPIPEGNQYWIEQQGSYTGPLHAGGHSNLWQSDGTEMTLITGLSHWIS